MKSHFLFICMLFTALTATAQGRDIKGVVRDTKSNPIIGASVRVKGVDISAITNIDGEFRLRNVPAEAKAIIVECLDMRTKTVKIENDMQITIKRKVMNDFALFIKAGYGTGALWEDEAFEPGDIELENPSYHVGIGVDIPLSNHWSFRPGVNYAKRQMEYSDSFSNHYDTWYYGEIDMTVIELPLQLAYKARISPSMNAVFSFGPYLGYNIDTDYYDYSYDYVSGNYSGSPFNYGGVFGIGFETRHFMFGITSQTGVIPRFEVTTAGGSWVRYRSFSNLKAEIGVKF